MSLTTKLLLGNFFLHTEILWKIVFFFLKTFNKEFNIVQPVDRNLYQFNDNQCKFWKSKKTNTFFLFFRTWRQANQSCFSACAKTNWWILEYDLSVKKKSFSTVRRVLLADIVRNHHQCQKTFFVARANTEFALFAHLTFFLNTKTFRPYYDGEAEVFCRYVISFQDGISGLEADTPYSWLVPNSC